MENNKINIPAYDPATGETEMIEVDFTRSVEEQNNLEEEGE